MASEYERTLYMLWPERRLTSPPEVAPPAGYALRRFRAGDEPGYLRLARSAGFDDDVRWLRMTLEQCLPDGFLFAVHRATGELVGTACAVDNPAGGHYIFPFGGELGNVAVAPAHRNRGVGRAVCAAATRRLIAAGYRSIRVGTRDHRLAAIKVFLSLGYEPFLYAPEMPERWRTICERLGWPFTPEAWPSDG